MTCSRITGTTMASPARAIRVGGISSSGDSFSTRRTHARKPRGGTRAGASEAGATLLLSLPKPSSTVLVRSQQVARAAHGLQIARLARVGLYLAPKACDLHVDCARIGAILGRRGQFAAVHRRAG